MGDALHGVPTFVLPASYQPAEYLTGPLAMRADDARWLVSTIVRKTANRHTDESGYALLSSTILRRVMYAHTSARVVRALKDGGVIETTPHSSGVRSKGYRLADRYLGDRCVCVSATDPRLIARIEHERQRQREDEQRNRWQPIHYALDREQYHATIGGKADNILAGLADHTRLCQDVLLSNFRRRQLPFSVGSTGRVFNSITGLKRELRTHLLIDGHGVGSVDICCAQPALLALVLSLHYPSAVPFQRPTYKLTAPGAPVAPVLVLPDALELGADFDEYAAAVVEGWFYELLCDRTGLDRATVKRRFLVDVLAKRGRYQSLVEDAFRAEFPSVHRAIRLINHDDHGALIRLLQRAESLLVVERVAPLLLSRGCRVVTLHDAVFSTAESLDRVEEAFRDVFAQLGFTLSLKREVAA